LGCATTLASGALGVFIVELALCGLYHGTLLKKW
jgi:hypothetical protein